MQSAEELFAEWGTEVTLEEIARHAGVGVATAYRHFASKSAIVEAMLESRIGKFLAVLHECESIADPREAFETYLYRICELQATDRGMREAISANHGIDKSPSSAIGESRYSSAYSTEPKRLAHFGLSVN